MYCNTSLGEDGDETVVQGFPSLINNVRKLVNLSAVVACFDNCGKGSHMTFFALHVSPFATLNFLFDELKIGMHASFLSSFLT